MEDKDKERLYKLSQEVIKTPLSGLIAQCYGVLKANWNDAAEFDIKTFADLFHIICVGTEGIIMLMWDDTTDKYYSIHVPIVNIAFIGERPAPESENLVIGGPLYDINFQFHLNVVEQGTAEDLYDRTQDTRDLITSGWSTVDRRYAIPVLHISPYDLCAISNLYEITYRLSWFTLFMLDYKSPYNLVRAFGITFCHKTDILTMSLFFNQSLQLFATLVNQPEDMEPFKRYIVRGYVNFHQQKPDDKMTSFVRNMYSTNGVAVPDMDNLTLLDTSQSTEVRFLIMTTAYMEGV
mgnify:CR=1 FL=1